MNIFGPSDDELRAREDKLRKDTAELEKRQADLDSDKSVFDHEKQIFETRKTSLDSEWQKLKKEEEELEVRRQEVRREEAAAKAKFTETQRKTFEEVIQARLDKCAAREKALAEYQSKLAVREEEISKREGEVSARDLDVTRREQNADAGFADKARALSDETRRKEQAVAEESELLKRLADGLAERSRMLDKRTADLDARELAVKDAESKRDAGFSTERASFRAQIEALRLENRSNEETAIAELRAKLHTKMDEDLAMERTSRLESLETELSVRREAVENREKELDDRDARLKEAEAKAAGEHRALEAEKEALTQDRKRLKQYEERQKLALKERKENLDAEVEVNVEEKCRKERAELESLRASNKDLQQELLKIGLAYKKLDAFILDLNEDLRKDGKTEKTKGEILSLFESLATTTASLKAASEELAARPSREDFDRQRDELTLLKESSKAREKAWEESEEWSRKYSLLKAEMDATFQERDQWKSRVEAAENLAEKYRMDLNRLTVSYAKEEEKDARIATIRDPVITADKVSMPTEGESPSEIDWLDGIGRDCDKYGIHFPKRILYAYHTALKTAEMSPLVVLAGVSGTGKSELPRLYSHFGGLLFEPVSVQPNWDSQESMLGFYNSIDNRFEAQRLLRFLAQSQTEWSEKYPGLKERMCMVLLDEMNLAHPELYFAEFLSKFETRRGKGPDEVPSLEVKLGTGEGMRYSLPLGRNVLWSGTMNQDETTKSLSDKVLDRAIVINFPRPNRLIRRTKLMRLEDFQPGASMTWKTWRSWLHKGESAFLNHEDLILPYQKFLEELNQHLGEAGRAIGHRVWQSVEAYMSAYPGMREAIDDKVARDKLMHVAFEDQLVQKVMPKLRGIDTRGNSRKKCLDPIRSKLLEGVGGLTFESLKEDFDLACELGYGQFMWQSANYIVDEVEQPTSTPKTTNNGTVG